MTKERIVTCDMMRESDRITIKKGTPSKELMARAAAGIFEAGKWKAPVGIVCGSGNNAGDGYACALLFAENGIECDVILLSDEFSDDGEYYFNLCRNKVNAVIRYDADTDFTRYNSILDCIFGTGFRGEMPPECREAVEKINSSGAYVVSADINSGINGTSGEGETFVKSDLTVSIGSYKYGHFLGAGKDAMKQKVNCDIGIELVRPWENEIPPREELLEILQRDAFGYFPPASENVRAEIIRSDAFFAGHAVKEEIELTVDTQKGDFTFPVKYVYPANKKKFPVFVFINFNSNMPDHYWPAEEIADRGFGVARIYYNDISTDDTLDFDRLGECFDRNSPATDPGKITLWSWAAQRVIDYLFTRDDTDTDNIAVIGHSRLGKTALLTGAFDERVKYTFSNDSGCMGAALEQYKHADAETYCVISKRFPFWFCGNYNEKAQSFVYPGFDQHYLLAACAPRFVCVSAATEDYWADSPGQLMSCKAASRAWIKQGRTGFSDNFVQKGICSSALEGDIGFFEREGTHYLSRHDWNCFMDFIESKMKECE